LTETVPANTTFNAGASTSGWSCPDGSPANTVCTVGLGRLAGGGGNGSATFAVTLSAVLPAGVQTITNTANVRDDGSNGPDPTPQDNTASVSTNVNATPDLRLSKSDAGTATTPGATLPYTLTVTNTGTQEATGVVLTETVPAQTTFNASASSTGWSCQDGSPANTTCTLTIGNVLGNGASRSALFAVNVLTPVLATVTQISNTASVVDDGRNGPDPTPNNNRASTTTPVTVRPTLAATKTADLDAVRTSDRIVYTVVVRNPGDVEVTNAVFTDTPDPLTILVAQSVTTTQGTVSVGNTAGDTRVQVDLGSLAGGDSATVTFAVRVSELPRTAMEITNQGMVMGTGVAGVLTDDPATPQVNDPARVAVIPQPLLDPVKQATLLVDADTSGGVTAGDTLRYTITLPNRGAGPATNVVFTDTPYANTGLVAGSVTTTVGTVTRGNTQGDTNIIVTLGTLAVHDSVTITFDVQLAAVLPDAVRDVRNQGLVSATEVPAGVLTDDPATAATQDPTVTPLQALPLVGATKTWSLLEDRDGDGFAGPGDTLRYLVTIQNTGSGAANAVTFTDAPDALSQLVVGSVVASQGTVTTGNTTGDASVEVTIGAIAAAANATVRFDAMIVTPLATGVTQLSNQGLVRAAGVPEVRTDDPTTATPGDPTVTPLAAAPDLVISINDGGVTATPGATVVYAVNFSNAGTQNATGAELRLTVPANASFNPTDSTAGWVCVPNGQAGSVCTLPIGALNVGNSGAAQFAVTVDAGLPADATRLVVNGRIADDGANGADLRPANNQASATTPIAGVPDLTLRLDDGGVIAIPGEVVSYTLTATNVRA